MARVVDGTIVFDDGTPMMGQQPVTGKRLIEVLQLLPYLIPAIGMAGFPTRGGGAGGFVASGGGGGGSQGTPMAGPAGATGTSGYSGYSGSSTGTSGFSGYSGSGGPGASGFSGYSGVGGPGTSGFSGYSGTPGPFTPEAATYVVHPTPGVGDFTTIQAALTALPASGGYILVREGTYAITTTNLLPAAKPVVIRGCGNATVIDLGAHAIAAFTIPSGAVENTPVCFYNFKVTGTEVASQACFEYNDADSLSELYMENITSSGIQIIVNITDGSFSNSGPGHDDVRIHMAKCRFRPSTTDATVILSNPGPGYPRCWMTEVELIGDSLVAVPGGRTDPLFGRIAEDNYFGDLYMEGCEMSIGGTVGAGESDFASFESHNSTIWNNDSTNTQVTFFTLGSFISLSAGSIYGNAIKGVLFNCSDGMTFSGTTFTNCALQLFGKNTTVGDGCYFLQTLNPYPSNFVIQINDEDMVIADSKFKLGNPPTGAAPAAVIDVEAPVTITGNDFSEVANGSNACVYINTGDCIVTSNRFAFAPTTGPNIREINGPNMYDDNVMLFTNRTGVGPIIDPVFPVGQGSTVEGTLDLNAAGSAGGVATNTIILRYRNPYGLAQTKGYVENIGANNFTIVETWITQNLGNFTRTTAAIAPTTKTTLDPFNLPAGLTPNSYQTVEYRVDISGTAIAWHTYFAGPGGVVGT